ncbi:outer membrane beta-barrel protein [Sphingobacterium psychroaquaticum]|uniref:Outer membrane protein beta-barrel domain-containing protein n=1 Tax=Sphingobacterium psychroaquaticum TaxID=561061 RepID=A0A1X7IPL6_9SPHI|nr:outer membrane beta-barrel protein [Sphingobacterium psychroaquaticum]SMG17050.1 Outer membrane protein beta-barrel domain-containing protein [Sphingobacterium psychroaquaticum]
MKDKNNKELIDVVREQLKAFEETPYKQGAWESYKATYESAGKTRRLTSWYWASAAAVVAMGIGLFISQRQTVDIPVQQVVHTDQRSTASPAERGLGNSSDAATELPLMNTNESEELARVESGDAHNAAVSLPNTFAQRAQIAVQQILSSITPETAATVQASQLAHTHIAVGRPVLRDVHDGDPQVADVDLGLGFALAQQDASSNFKKENQALALAPKKMRILSKMELGAFLSPSTTDSKIDLGGGLILGYQLNDKLTLRTGASFNQYEVGILPSGMYGKEQVQNSPVVGQASKDMPYKTYATLPNINAVTGKVQTLDIPLELQYKMGKQFYTSVGVSYAAVLSQERFNHYQENADPLMFSSTSNTERPTNEDVKVVERKVQSVDNNVDPNGFAGFVNFSIGKKTNLSKALKLSIEPYVKIPVGQFKRADMNYTNGGIKVITTF